MLTLRALGEAQTRLLYEHQLARDFPPSELRPLSAILSMRRAGLYDVLGAYDGGEMVGYALLYCPKEGGVLLLDYLAVEPHARSRGIGTTMLSLLKDHYAPRADALLIECERPKAARDEAEARRRIRFYLLGGAELTRVRIWLFEVQYSILVLPCSQTPRSEDWAEAILSMYRQMLSPRLFAQNVRLIRS
ncbi:MAG: GNAT family N-acetyltransferase [Clostridia bacterium]|nr:GNAT family N-acetyltransferase [Clostridia bacterium]